jgi:hypothetical protein
MPVKQTESPSMLHQLYDLYKIIQIYYQQCTQLDNDSVLPNVKSETKTKSKKDNSCETKSCIYDFINKSN